MRSDERRVELSDLRGVLYPGTDLPTGACGPQNGEVVLSAGTVLVKVANFPITVIAVNKEPVLVLDRGRTGELIVRLDIRGSDGKIVARLNDEGFVVNERNYFKMNRVDESSLVVYDQNGDEVLNARYQNKNAFRLQTRFYSSGRLIDIAKMQANINGFEFANVCFVVPITTGPLFNVR